MASILNHKSLEDWYHVTSEELQRMGAAGLLGHFGGSLPDALQDAFPNHHWQMHRFPRKTAEHRDWKLHLETFGRNLGVTQLGDWYKIDGRKLPPYFSKRDTGLSLQEMLKLKYPEHNWEPWRFGRTPAGWWNEISNQRRFLDDHVIPGLGIKNFTDWYQVTTRQLDALGANVLLKMHRSNPDSLPSIFLLVSKNFPEHTWHPWLFDQSHFRKGYWKKIDWQRRYLDWLGGKLGFPSLESWYSMNPTTLSKWNGDELLSIYKKSSIKLFSAVYPDHQWDESKFIFWGRRGRRTKLTTIEDQRKVLNQLESQFGVQSLEEWYSISVNLLCSSGGMFFGRRISSFRILTSFLQFRTWYSFKIQRFTSCASTGDVPRSQMGSIQI
jgi:hypothetical protein